MTSLGLFAAVAATLSAESPVVSHVVAWGDTTSPLIRNFPDSLSAPRWIRACGERSVAYRYSGKLTWWGFNAFDLVRSPTHRMSLRGMACSEELGFGLTDSGTVVRWGGTPPFGDPTPPMGLRGVVSLAAGSFHAAALKTDGSVVAWGGNLDSVVSKTNGKTGIAAIAAAGVQTILLRRDSTVEVAGGQLTMVDQVPKGLSGIVAVASGGRHGLALRANGTVVAWGDTTGGNLRVPASLDSVVAIAAGGYHSLALRADGSVVCWGKNDKGQCDVPSSVVEVVAVTAGLEHSLALRRDGTVVGWGSNAKGQRDAPMKTIPVESIHVGNDAAAAILQDGRVVAWGDIPLAAFPTLPGGRRWKSISFGSTPHAVGRDDQGKPYAWGSSILGVGTMPESLTTALQAEATRAVTVVLTPDRRLVAWGEDNDGLVTGANALTNVIQFDASEYRLVALRADSTVHQWGKQIYAGMDSVPDSARGALAVAATDQSFLALKPGGRVFAWNPRPALAAWHRPPVGLDSVVALSGGSLHALARRANGQVVCWGDTTTPLCRIPEGLPPASVALAGTKASLALIPVRSIAGPPTGVSRSQAVAASRHWSLDGGALRWKGDAPVRVRVLSAAGRPVLPSTTLQPGERLGANLARGLYLVRVEGERETFRWVRTGR